MALTQEQIVELKDQLREQVNSLPEDKKAAALAQIDSLSSEALESMLKEQRDKPTGKGEEKGVFRMIVDKDIKSVFIDENKEAMAVLDIAPISKGHVIVIPKIPISDSKLMPTSAFTLAKKIAKKIGVKLKSKGTQVQTEMKFGENIINVIPFYETQLNINSPRSKPSTEELEKVASLIRVIKKPKIEKIKIKSKETTGSQTLKIPRRIP